MAQMPLSLLFLAVVALFCALIATFVQMHQNTVKIFICWPLNIIKTLEHSSKVQILLISPKCSKG